MSSLSDYKNHVYANLPAGMTASNGKFTYNNHRFNNFPEAKRYRDYLLKTSSSPAALFGPSDTGWFYDNSDFSTMFQDSAGTIPVTDVGQPVGLQLDKSKGLVLGAELVTNGTFDADTSGWAAAVTLVSFDARGAIRVEPTTIFNSDARQTSIPTKIGATYRVTFDVVEAALGGGGNSRVGLWASSADVSVYGFVVIPRTVTTRTTYTFVAVATSASSTFRLGIGSNTGFAVFDNISVRELPGNHRSQSISLNRPILARHPVGGRRNLLTFSEQFDNADWLKTRTTASGQRVTANAGDHAAYVERSLLGRPASSHAITVAFAPAAGRHRYVWLGDRGTVPLASATFDLDTATVVGQNAGVTPVVETLPDGSVSCSIVYARTTVGTSSPQFAFAGASHTSDRPSLTWLGGEFLDAKAQFELGSTATPYQKVVSAFDVTEAGVPDQYYLSYNGTNNSLATSAFDWGTDKATVVAGVRKLSDAAVGVLVELSSSLSSFNGSMFLASPGVAGSGRIDWASKGTLKADVQASGLATPVTVVATGIGDIAGDVCTLRINGALARTTVTDQGTGNFGNYPVYFGARAGTSVFFNGYEYSQFGINRLLTESELALVERYTNSRTGAY